jgi:HK97 family phage major capsid protein
MPTVLKTRRERLEQLVGEMRSFADECDAKDGGPSAEDIEKLNKMSGDVTALVEEVKSEAAVSGTLDMAKAFLGDLSGTNSVDTASIDGGSGIVDPRGMTLGEAFAASPAYEEFVKQFRGNDGKIREVTGIKSAAFEVPTFSAFGKDALTGASATSAGAFVEPTRLPGYTDLVGERELTIRDLCTVIPIGSDTFEYVQVTGRTSNAAPVPEASTSADIGSGNPEVTAAQGGLKPESGLTFRVVSSPVETIAHLIPITRRAAADAGQVRAIVDAFLIEGLNVEEENQVLNGDGDSPNLKGILSYTGSGTAVDNIRTYTPDAGETDIDAVVGAIRTMRHTAGRTRRRPTAMVVNPLDWYSDGFLLAKNGVDGGYLIGDPRASVDQLQMLWGLRVLVSEAIDEGSLLVGDFRQAVIADRQQSSIYVTDSHKDWFQRNLLAVLAERRVGFGLLDPGAFVLVTPGGAGEGEGEG